MAAERGTRPEGHRPRGRAGDAAAARHPDVRLGRGQYLRRRGQRVRRGREHGFGVTGADFQPDLRVSWRPDADTTVWGALIESLIADTQKHIAMLKFVKKHLKTL